MFILTLVMALYISFVTEEQITIQSGEQPIIKSISVETTHRADIIFEYALGSFCEGEKLDEEKLNCFKVKLLSTSLFTDVTLDLKYTDNKECVDIIIYPKWIDEIDYIFINQITIQDFNIKNSKEFYNRLNQKGINQSLPILKYSFKHIRKILQETAIELYNDKKSRNIIKKEFRRPWIFVEPAMPGKVNLVISSWCSGPCRPIHPQNHLK